MAVYQSLIQHLENRYRGQAPSHILTRGVQRNASNP